MGSQKRRSRMSVEEVKLKIMGEVTGMLGVIVLNLGKDTGVWKAMRGGSNLTPKQVAEKAGGLSERYLEELLRAAALHGYIEFTAGEGVATKEWDSGIEVMETDTFSLSKMTPECLTACMEQNLLSLLRNLTQRFIKLR